MRTHSVKIAQREAAGEDEITEGLIPAPGAGNSALFIGVQSQKYRKSH
jgi:hypothetical protein